MGKVGTLNLCLIILVIITGCEPSQSTPDTSAPSTSASPSSSPAPNVPLADVDVEIEEPGATNPATFAMAVDNPTTKSGSVLTLAVRSAVAEGWHIYAIDKPTDVAKPTKLTTVLPDGFSLAGGWDIPEPHAKEGVYQYDGDTLFRHLIEVGEDVAPGSYDIGCEIAYQPCTDSSCLRPMTTTVTTTVVVE